MTQSFQQARRATESIARLDPPGVLWWRAQLRRRHAALERISRPIDGAYLFALLTLLFVAVGLAVVQAPNRVQWLSRLSEFAQSPPFNLQSLASLASLQSDWSLMLLLSGLAVLTLLGGIVLYLASEKP